MSAPFILILYHHLEARSAHRIYEALKSEHPDKASSIKRYWLSWDLSNDWERQEALVQSRHLIVLLSPEFINAYAQYPDWNTGLQRDPDGNRGIIIPIRISPCSFSHILNTVSSLDLFGLEEIEITDAMSKKLYQVLNEADSRWEKYQNPAPATLPYFEKPHFPDKGFFSAPQRNRFFTGQKRLLNNIEQSYRQAQPGSPYTIVLSGLRGSGKTQLAIEYAHSYFSQELYQYVLWVDGGTASGQLLDEKVKHLIKNLHQKGLIKHNRQDAKTLQEWLLAHQKWLLVFDEVDDVSRIPDYLPPRGFGHILVTTCTKIVNFAGDILDVHKMDPTDAILFLLGRSRGRVYKTLDEVSADDRHYAEAIVEVMQHFPLAIDQVAAFLDAKKRSPKSYVESYLWNRNIPLITFLKERGGPDLYHPLTLVESWQQQFRRLQSTHPMAADLLIFCAFFNPSGVYEKIFTDGRSMLDPHLSAMTDNFSSETSLDGLIEALRKYSLIERENDMLSVHPFLPLVLADWMDQPRQELWARCATLAVHQACFQYQDQQLSRQDKQRWLPQLKACQPLIDQWQLQRLFPLQVQELMARKAKWEQKLEQGGEG